MTRNTPDLHQFLTLDLMRDVLQASGYRVAQGAGPDGSPVLASATGGLGFEVRFANPMTPAPTGEGESASAWADASFRTAFTVQGELPLTLVNRWNVTHRFARLLLAEVPAALPASNVSQASSAPGTPSVPPASNAPGTPSVWLVLEMDVVALGGVQTGNLRAQTEIWDRLVQELIAYLRAELPKLAKSAPIAEPAAREADPAAPEPVAPEPAA